MNKLKENIKEGYFLFVTEWWGLSDKPGATGIFIYPNGNYIKKKTYFKNPENDTQEEGMLDEETLSKLTSFVNAKMINSSTKMIHDYGCVIELTKDANLIKIENDIELFKEILAILPFKDISKS